MLVGVITLVPCGAVLAQDAPPLDPNGAAENRVFLVSTRITDEADVFLHQIDPRVGRIALISNETIDPDHNLVPNWDLVEQAVENECPPDYEGIIVLDWEGEFFHVLKDGPEHPDFLTVRQRGINLINFVKNKRPNAKVGMYGLPGGKWNVDQQTLMPLYDVLDVLTPAGAIGQSDPEEYPVILNKFKKNVEFALELDGDRPVLVFHSPRHTHAGSVLVEQELWQSHLAHTFDYEHEGKRAAGVIIWDPTIRMYYQNDLEAADGPFPPDFDVWAYITDMEIAYYCTGANAVIPDLGCVVPSPAGELLGDIVDFAFIPPGDGQVNGADLAYLLMQWGLNPGSPADLVNAALQAPGDGVVDGADLAMLLSNWSE